MRIDVRAAVVVVAMSCSLYSARSVAADQPAANAAEEADHESLRRLRAVYEKAIHDDRIDTLGPYLASDFHGVMVTGRVVRSLDDLQRYWRDLKALIGEGGTYTTTVNPELSVLLGDIALARGTTEDVVVTDKRQEFRFASNWTAALRKENGVWKIRQVQGSIDPVTNPFVREFTRRAVVLSAAVAGGVGLVVGGGIAWFLGRRRGRRLGA
jgi:ketosteroid isomerase-like protein